MLATQVAAPACEKRTTKKKSNSSAFACMVASEGAPPEEPAERVRKEAPAAMGEKEADSQTVFVASRTLGRRSSSRERCRHSAAFIGGHSNPTLMASSIAREHTDAGAGTPASARRNTYLGCIRYWIILNRVCSNKPDHSSTKRTCRGHKSSADDGEVRLHESAAVPADGQIGQLPVHGPSDEI